MRISDWSSDVCSSDLAAGFAADYAPDLDIRGAVTTGTPYVSANDPEATSRGGDPNRVDPAIAYTYYLTLTVQQTRPELTDGDIYTARAAPLIQQARTMCNNGRGSGREGGCQDV